MRHVFQVLIIGASIAGAATACRLARAGVQVGLVDKATFPRRKACGEGLSAIGLQELSALGFQMESVPNVPLFQYSVWSESCETPFAVQFAAGLGEKPLGDAADRTSPIAVGGIGVERLHLDNWILEQVKQCPSCSVFEGCSVRDISITADGAVVRCEGLELAAQYLVLSDGAHSPSAQRLGLPHSGDGGQRYGGNIVLEGAFSELPSAVHICLESEMQVCCTPVAATRLNMAFLSNYRSHPVIGNRAELRNTALRLAPKIGFTGAVCEDIRGSASVGKLRRPPVTGRVLTVGDCCEQLDPIGGMGMTQALISARCAATALQQILLEGIPEGDAFARFVREREKSVRPLRAFTWLTYQTLVRGAVNPLARQLRESRLAGIFGTAAHHSRSTSAPFSERVAAAVLQTVGGMV